ncbi:YkgJ family cysteine cluster protein [Methanolapillus ohkumae]|uniref:YkgJ family cysteine cluster protein n=1 Tax=Methanolapillus ohkumae TaxID=3028298 RepID=A0AA96V856_9EURY|nr:hypothetical protein MsAm2_08330 [Methanosarcinaceae archaeon Am2]
MSLEKIEASVLKTVQSSGFSCKRCGKCCTREDGDNSVFLMPDEIQSIQLFLTQNKVQIHDSISIHPIHEKNNLSSSSFTVPLFPDFYSTKKNSPPSFDSRLIFKNLDLIRNQITTDGIIYTFGWMLKRTQNGTCVFLDPKTNICRIYPVRPLLCKTYPFYIDFYDMDPEKNKADVIECECDGLETVSVTEKNVSKEMAANLLERVFKEKNDYIKTKENFEKHGAELEKKTTEKYDFVQKAGQNFKNGFLKFVICDSTGISEVFLPWNEFYSDTEAIE